MALKATSDFFIRYLLGLNTHVHLLLDFINAVLEDSGLPGLSEVQIMNPFNLKQYVDDKELPKNLIERASGCRTRLDRWMFFFNNAYRMEEAEVTYLTTQDPIMEDVWKAYQAFQQDQALMDQNIARMKRLSDLTTGLSVARDEGFNDGME